MEISMTEKRKMVKILYIKVRVIVAEFLIVFLWKYGLTEVKYVINNSR